MTTWTTIATSPNFCASKSCKDVCVSNPKCTYLAVDDGPDDDILYARSKDGTLLPGVPTPGPNGPSPPPGPPSPAFDLINSIKKLQKLEKYLFQQLEMLNVETPNATKQQDDIIDKINDLSELRNDLFGQLGKIYINLDKNSQIERSALTDQITTTNMMENQLGNLKSEVYRIKAAKRNKLRMVQIGEYEYLRYSAHKSAMKTLAFTSLVILIFAVLLKNKYIPDLFAKVGIILSVSIGGVILVKQVWDMVTRDNQNYNRFTQPELNIKGHPGQYQYTVWKHNLVNFRKLFDLFRGEVREDWGKVKQAGDDFEDDFNKASGDASRAMQCKADGGRWDQPSESCKHNEGFQVVRAYQSANKLKSAPFN